MQKTELLHLEPRDKINFIGNVNSELKAEIKITNLTNTKQSVKVKCTSNELFQIRPAISFIEPNQTALINIHYKPNEQISRNCHHFGIYHIPAPEGCSSTAVWEEHYGPPQGQFRIKMFQERFGSASASSSRSVHSSSRSRVHSAPPAKYDRRVPHRFGEDEVKKPMTPDPEYVSRVLQARISSALAGPEIRLAPTRSGTQSSEDAPPAYTSSRKIFSSRSSIKRAGMMAKGGTSLVPIDDPEELAMLRSIGRSEYSFESAPKRLEHLHIHEFEDKSDEDDSLMVSTTSATQRRRRSLVRQLEQDDSSLVRTNKGRNSAVFTMEDRLSGFRHEKMRSSTRSGDSEGAVQFAGLVYDADFDCYYNPTDDTYYRVNSVEKPIA